MEKDEVTLELKLKDRIPKDFKLNFHDLVILLTCMQSQTSITELQDKVNIAYKNLNQHIKKLVKYKLLKVENKGKGLPKSIITNVNNKHSDAFLTALFILLGVEDASIQKQNK